MLQDHPHAIHFKHILYFGEAQDQTRLLRRDSPTSPFACRYVSARNEASDAYAS